MKTEDAVNRVNKILKNFEGENPRDKIDKTKATDEIRGEILGNIEFMLYEGAYIGYDEANEDFYLLYPKSQNSRRHIVHMPVKFKGVAIDDNNNKFINAEINGIKKLWPLDDFKNELKNYAITGTHLEKIVQFLLLYLNSPENVKNATSVHQDVIYIHGDTIKVDEVFEINLEQTIHTIYKMYENATSPDNFLINLAYYTLSPLSYYIRKKQKMFPFLINAGAPQTGKTTFMRLFGNIGYAQDPLKSHFTRNDLKTFYTLMRSRSESILPITLEDVDLEWIKSQATMLKGSADSINGGSRGYFTRVLKYESKSQLTFDTNDAVDVETAQLERFLVCNFNFNDAKKVDISSFDALSDELTPGFMFSILNELFSGIKLSDLINEIYNVANRDELKINLIKYVIKKLNELMPEDMKFPEPNFLTFANENNAIDWLAEIYNIGKNIFDNLSNNVHLYEINSAEIDFNQGSLYITASGYSLLQKHINIPYKSIRNIFNNFKSSEFTAKMASHRFCGGNPVRSLVITLRDEKDNTHDSKGLNFNPDSLPEGPVKESMKEEQELKEFKKQNPRNSQEKQETHQEVQKPREIRQNPKMYYYKIINHFDSYNSSYFDGSDIILDSFRPIIKRNSTDIAYILVKVLIPENLSKLPNNWMKFLSDSQEIQQKQFEVLSRGDVQ